MQSQPSKRIKNNSIPLTKTTILLVLLPSCQLISPKSEHSAVQKMAPKAWTASPQARAGMDDGWISRLGDKRLVKLAEEAVRNQPSMKVAEEKVNQAAQAAKLAGVSMRPTLGAGVSGQTQETIFLGIPGAGSASFDSYGVSIESQWEIDLWGRIRAGQSAVIGEWQAAAYEKRSAEISLAAQVAKAWFSLAEAHEQLSLSRQALQWRKNLADIVEGRYQNSLSELGGTPAQLRLAKTQLANAQTDMEQRKGTLQSATRQLELLLGRYPSGQLSHNLPSRLPKRLPSTVPAGLPSELLLRRPDVLAAERRYAATKYRVKEAKRAVFPRLILTGQAGTTTTQLKSLLDSGFGVWSLGASITQSILTGGQIKAEVLQRSSAKREKLASFQQAVLNAFGEVELALVRETAIRRQIASIKKALSLADQSVESSQLDYQEGTDDLLTMINNQTQRISLRSQELSLRRFWYENRINLHLALGGDFKLRSK